LGLPVCLHDRLIESGAVIAGAGGDCKLFPESSADRQGETGANWENREEQSAKSEGTPAQKQEEQIQTQRTRDRRTGEMNVSLSGSARLIVLLTDYGQRSILATNRPCWPRGANADLKMQKDRADCSFISGSAALRSP
jgi:hypothetical protein